MKKALLVLAVVVLYVLHQDIWNWRRVRIFDVIPLGAVPIGLFYHACFSVAASLVMWMLVKFAWPAHLEEEVEQQEPKERSAS